MPALVIRGIEAPPGINASPGGPFQSPHPKSILKSTVVRRSSSRAMRGKCKWAALSSSVIIPESIQTQLGISRSDECFVSHIVRRVQSDRCHSTYGRTARIRKTTPLRLAPSWTNVIMPNVSMPLNSSVPIIMPLQTAEPVGGLESFSVQLALSKLCNDLASLKRLSFAANRPHVLQNSWNAWER